ncbi:MAG: hypothetical protein RIS97_789 [Pseudomonadota bacterium]|jgi:hypothetical protein
MNLLSLLVYSKTQTIEISLRKAPIRNGSGSLGDCLLLDGAFIIKLSGADYKIEEFKI